MAQAPPDGRERVLGPVGSVEFTLALTERPWDLGVDVFVLSMGSGFGGLARAVRGRYPSAPWESVELLDLRPHSPGLLRLTGDYEPGRWAVLATVHPDPAEQPTQREVLDAIPVAVRSALALASRVQCTSLLLPLLGAGRLGVPDADVAREIVSGAIDAILAPAELPGPLPSRIVLLAQDRDNEVAIEAAWKDARPWERQPGETPAPPPPKPLDLFPLDPSAAAALAYADALRSALGRTEVHMEHLLLGLAQQDAGQSRRMLEESGLPPSELMAVLAESAKLGHVPSVTPGPLEGLPPLSGHVTRAVDAALLLAQRDSKPVVESAHLLRGALSVNECTTIAAAVRRAPALGSLADQSLTTAILSELIGGLAPDLVDPDQGIPLDKDDLGVSTYVTMMATAIARKDTKLPLSIGLFGEWGSGKSYFMGLLRGQVEKLAREGGEAYHSGIVQIGFNAWSYADTNLWASLGDEIFRSLAGPPEDAANEAEDLRHRRERLQEWLAGAQGRLQELEAAKAAASGEVAKLKGQLEEQRQDRTSSAKDLLAATAAAATANPQIRGALDKAWSELGVRDEAEQARVLADAVTGTRDDLVAVTRRASDSRRYLVAAVAVVGAVLLVLAVAASGVVSRWLAGSGVTVLLAAGVTFATITRRLADGVRVVTGLADDIRQQEQVGQDRKVADAVRSVRAAEAREQVLQAQLDEVVARIGELGRELVELSPGQRLYAFLAERAASDDYRRQLGLIATIRRDFERLALLQEEWRERPTEDSPPPIDRIVLYIDDLDRCTPRQVVEVLQAVHLLLALDLFVVVVGVDPRWLLHALRDQYRSLLTAGAAPAPAEDSVPSGADVGAQGVALSQQETDRLLLSTPQDYLEKIFNVPFVLPAMTPKGFDTMIRRLSEPEPEPSTTRRPRPSSAAGRPLTAPGRSRVSTTRPPRPSHPSPSLPLLRPSRRDRKSPRCSVALPSSGRR